jgi:glycosyltransferase involved in cell wall biosynthesis
MKLSLILMVWNTSHLLARTLETLKGQTIDDWELIIVDDNSEDDVEKVLRQNGEGLPVRYCRLEHGMGMRGNTVSLNYGIRKAVGDIVMWSTPEVMLPPDTLKVAYDTHMATDEWLWVTVPSHGMTSDLQLRIDDVDWRSNVHNIKSLLDGTAPEDWDSVWFHLNFHPHGRRDEKSKREIGQEYGNNQTVAVNREAWKEKIGSFPYFLDYGSDDPWIASKRKHHGYTDLTLWDQEAYHQWHPTSQFWMAQDKAPYWNFKAHTIDNLLGDPEVPPGGTCETWDLGDRSPMGDGPKREAMEQERMVTATGFSYR